MECWKKQVDKISVARRQNCTLIKLLVGKMASCQNGSGQNIKLAQCEIDKIAKLPKIQFKH